MELRFDNVGRLSNAIKFLMGLPLNYIALNRADNSTSILDTGTSSLTNLLYAYGNQIGLHNDSFRHEYFKIQSNGMLQS